MLFKIDDDEVGVETVLVEYTFMRPCQIKRKMPDGSIQLMGYGIGDKVGVMEPRHQTLVPKTERLTEIPLSDGSILLEIPENISVKRLY